MSKRNGVRVLILADEGLGRMYKRHARSLVGDKLKIVSTKSLRRAMQAAGLGKYDFIVFQSIGGRVNGFSVVLPAVTVKDDTVFINISVRGKDEHHENAKVLGAKKIHHLDKGTLVESLIVLAFPG